MLTVFISGLISCWRLTLTLTQKLSSFSNTRINCLPVTRSWMEANLEHKDYYWYQMMEKKRA